MRRRRRCCFALEETTTASSSSALLLTRVRLAAARSAHLRRVRGHPRRCRQGAAKAVREFVPQKSRAPRAPRRETGPGELNIAMRATAAAALSVAARPRGPGEQRHLRGGGSLLSTNRAVAPAGLRWHQPASQQAPLRLSSQRGRRARVVVSASAAPSPSPWPDYATKTDWNTNGKKIKYIYDGGDVRPRIKPAEVVFVKSLNELPRSAFAAAPDSTPTPPLQAAACARAWSRCSRAGLVRLSSCILSYC